MRRSDARGAAWLATLALLLAVLPACRKGAELPAVAGAKTVVPFSAVVLFREMPVSSREFDAPERRWTASSSPRFDDGRLRSHPGADGGTVFVEIPPTMAFKNRGADCGSVDDRRVCALPWDQAELTLCGRPFEGHLEITNEHLADSTLFVCRVVTPAHGEADGGWAYAERDCTRAERIRLRTIDPADLQFRIGDLALVADPGATTDRKVCERVAKASQKPAP
ncbi:MAG: hypothetical protein HY905_12135 [Deltaproteobacteria bacterium]|nr:hypothetical protein [Deltaproteobacteria bacterium]